MKKIKKVNQTRGAIPAVILLIAVIAIVGAAIFVKTRGKEGVKETPVKTPPVTTVTPQQLLVILRSQNESGQEGTATITAAGNQKVKVTVNLHGKNPNVPQPAHIHTGSCVNLGAVRYPLVSLEDGNSVTTLDFSIVRIITELPLAINVHKSPAEATIYVACGEVTTTSPPQKGSTRIGTAAPREVEDTEGLGVTTVVYSDRGFPRGELTIKKGQRVVFVNKSPNQFWPASDPHPVHTIYPEFDARRRIEPGDTYSFTFEKVGTWHYHDHLKSVAKGTVIVEE